MIKAIVLVLLCTAALGADQLAAFKGKRNCLIKSQITQQFQTKFPTLPTEQWVLTFSTYPRFDRGSEIYVRQWEYQKNQLWRIDDQGRIESEYNGYVLEVANGNSNPGASVVIWGKHNGNSQKWTLDENGYLLSALPNVVRVLEVVADERGKQLNTRIHNPVGGSYQKWTIQCDVL
eukprot:TRINITY_DN94052_c0_g1_i1.p1 TRINITY_DN94052_c0_g1~~TRINITY_DN94052_c0_g1_i1.p1  ORF type:complete len:191 (-),score=26.62 TRINITY_DN94052_c0_g1_i1:29-556(-)